MSQDRSSRDVLAGVVLGAAAGFLAGILLAPKSGRETREDLRRGAEKAWTIANEKLDLLQDELATLVIKAKAKLSTANAKTRGELNSLIQQARDARRMSREVARAVKDGSADDEDLDMAVKQATEARNHLQAYLKKK